MLKRNFRLIEALGMLLLLATWGLNSLSVEYWNDASTSLKSRQAEILDHYNHIQITANVRLEAAIQTESLLSPPLPDEDLTLQPFQRTWRSPDVRRAWLQRTYDNVFWLGRLRDAVEDLNAKYNLAAPEKVTTLRASLAPIENKIVSLAEARRQGWVPFQPFPEQTLSADAAENVQSDLAEIANNTFSLTEELQQGISRNREHASAFYSSVFILGTLLLLVAKLLEWRSDLSKDERSGPPRKATSGSQALSGRPSSDSPPSANRKEKQFRSKSDQGRSESTDGPHGRDQEVLRVAKPSGGITGQSTVEQEAKEGEVADADPEPLESKDRKEAL